MTKLILLIMLICCITFLSADELGKSFGMSVGYISGSGFSYRVMNEKSGCQIAGGMFYSRHKEEYYDSDDNYYKINNDLNISATFYYNLINKETSRFYLLAGSTLFRRYKKFEKLDFHDYNHKIAETENYYLNIGLGIGLEFPLTNHFHFSIDWPWYYDNKANFLKFIPQAGLHYYFMESK